MSEQVSIALLKDSKSQVEQNLLRIKTNLIKWPNVDKSDQNRLKITIGNDFKSSNGIIEVMRVELKQIKDPNLEREFKDCITMFKSDIKKYQEDLANKQRDPTDTVQLGSRNDDFELKDKKNSEMTSQELFNKGSNILKDDRAALERVDKRVKEDIDIASQIKNELNRQNEQLDKTQKNLKEMDSSLSRASKQLVGMLKMYATDKIIMCMIGTIVIVIIVIAVLAATNPDAASKLNLPSDIFAPKNNTKSRLLFLNNYNSTQT